jgi:hypothetical protein
MRLWKAFGYGRLFTWIRANATRHIRERKVKLGLVAFGTRDVRIGDGIS